MKTIGIITALTKEMLPIYNQLGSLVGSDEFFNGVIYHYVDGDRVFYVATSGIGEIYAAAAVELLIVKYRAEVILNFGLAGSLNSELAIGDLVLVKNVVHHQYDISEIGAAERGQYQGRPSAFWQLSRELMDGVQAVLSEPLREVTAASGDKFISDRKSKADLIRHFNADICDMESAAIAIITEANGIPALIVKAVSDNADDNAVREYERSVDEGIYHYRRIVRNIVEVL
ncbi:MAG: 5'-methylthioadenosine/S-adenosylhomocysteine nucleosidase [Clostridiales bacterium]|jgi:5'-methylthioadenosine/S-adenosylhomocysteine nucleosidase|nr:5'-methylthioadenosine/S-adenosylhomocysteine nucleosidase [Clostridiales bacterium]